ncbi:MAG TPA: CPBP family intramembrane glutamic endopeptidase [Candidatus Acidoferrales bacterium]|nr:CPBP family intramembrane glutamic endopeptidase [Candidatus Acidoferrales bacterium]
MSFSTAAAIWAAIVALAAFLGMWRGFGGSRFILALGVAAILFAFELFLAAPRILELAQKLLGSRGGIVAPLVPLFAVLVYAFGVTGDWRTMLAGAAYAVLPSILIAGSTGKSPGTWEDYVAVILIWLPVEFRWMYRLFSYPPPLTHTLAILMALGTAVAAFVLLRRLEGIGYAVEWRGGFGLHVVLTFVLFAAIAIPLGIHMHFLVWDPTLARLRSLPLAALGILFFTAWPEEFLFRGLLQNLLSRTCKSRWAGLIIASVIFGLSHIFHAPYPNWKYVALATIAGLFYGHAWMKTGSLLPGTLVHALVDVSWHLLFR